MHWPKYKLLKKVLACCRKFTGMKRIAFLLLVMISLSAVSCEVSAQQVIATFDKDPRKDTVNRNITYPVVLGASQLSGGYIGKQLFDSLLQQGVQAADSGNKIAGFVFNYMERNIYEDSVGNIIPVTDLLMEYCPGSFLTPNVAASIYTRTKRGDTAFFDDIRVVLPDGKEGRGKGMKFVIE
jgi:hypothetical protein